MYWVLVMPIGIYKCLFIRITIICCIQVLLDSGSRGYWLNELAMIIHTDVEATLRSKCADLLLTALDHCRDVVQVTDTQDRVIYENNSTEKILGEFWTSTCSLTSSTIPTVRSMPTATCSTTARCRTSTSATMTRTSWLWNIYFSISKVGNRLRIGQI